jgi:hypothetical protein
VFSNRVKGDYFMALTNYAKEMMGFKRLSPPTEISCNFFVLKVYSLDGIDLAESEPVSGGRLNQFVTFAIGNQINELCHLLWDDELVVDIASWEKQYDANKPYIVTLTTDNSIHSSQVEWLQEFDDRLRTYGAYNDVKRSLRKLVAECEVPAAVRAVAALSSEAQLVKIRPKFTHFVGRTVDGRYIEDVNFTGSATISTARGVQTKQAVAAIESDVTRSVALSERCARLAYAAMEEVDSLKSFLFAWTAVEVFINQVYGFNASDEFPIDKVPSHLVDRIRSVYKDKDRGLNIRTIAQKLYFLAAFKWESLTTQELDTILSAKRIRDDFAHGSEISAVHLPTSALMTVLYKLLRST